ncbi:RNA polymerase, sigma-24 subunit, RpoE [Magnetococcus marinus MC-1]|uniref:RNA polymerase sigma factor n=1 Tax=Magnetococcus marinus (strain ATCC BAA-1437 / JCM 17883 / MC-1) TaxID=156889 RepID=A0L8I6_MAGMM|nr:RNA polymerase sigma factor RpoE [Magnetococcus marinus]ABK44279.1 RNA polymerase, sigma-24 subunit, RpoE [Magnetococcus marinus MC-1]
MNEADEILVEKTKQGDKKAYEVLVRKYQGRVASVISRTVSDPVRVQDLTQEAFLKAYRALHHFRGDAAFYTWLYRIAVNTAKNFVMSQDRGIPMSDMDLEDADRLSPQLRDYDTPENQVLRGELMDALKVAIEELAPTMKQAIALRDLEGKSYEEIAEIMGCPIGTVRSRIFRGRQEIVNKLKDHLPNGNLAGHHGL